MRKLLVATLAVVFLLSLVPAVFAVGSADEAKAMVDRAIAFAKANGKEKAFAEFTNQKGQFIKEDLYVYVLDMKGVCLAHGGNEKLVGKDVSPLKDSDGKFFIKAVVESAKAKGTGWEDYHWVNPVTKSIDKKSTYYKKDGELIYACGIYKQ